MRIYTIWIYTVFYALKRYVFSSLKKFYNNFDKFSSILFLFQYVIALPDKLGETEVVSLDYHIVDHTSSVGYSQIDLGNQSCSPTQSSKRIQRRMGRHGHENFSCTFSFTILSRQHSDFVKGTSYVRHTFCCYKLGHKSIDNAEIFFQQYSPYCKSLKNTKSTIGMICFENFHNHIRTSFYSGYPSFKSLGLLPDLNQCEDKSC